MQSTGNFVGRSIKLSAGVQLGHHHLRRRNFFSVDLHVIHGNSAPVVDYGDGVVDVNGDVNLLRETSKRFVDGVVHDFVYQVMQPHLTVGADVHGWTLAYRLHAAKNFDGIGRVIAVASAIRRRDRSHFSVFCFGIYDGSINLFCGHSAPRKCPNLFFELDPAHAPGKRLENRLRPCFEGHRRGDFKLLKLLILRVIWRLLKLYHTGEVFETFSGTLNRLGKLALLAASDLISRADVGAVSVSLPAPRGSPSPSNQLILIKSCTSS